jgi:hypothetical protein
MPTFRERLKAQLGAAEDSFMDKIAEASAVPPQFLSGKPKEEKKEKEDKKEDGGDTLKTAHVHKIAQQCFLLSSQLQKMAEVGPGAGSGTIPFVEPPTQGGIPVRGKAQGADKTDAPKMESSSKIVNPGTLIKNDIEKGPGEGETMKVDKAKAAQIARVYKILKKAAIAETTAGPGSGPNQDTTKDGPQEPIPEHAKKLQSLEKAKNMKPVDSRKEEKDDLSQYFNEPAYSKKTDPVLHDMFDHTQAAGAKIASAREYLSKIASRGCVCNGEGTCAYCTIQKSLNS